VIVMQRPSAEHAAERRNPRTGAAR
jgi:hypothetical protein